MFRFKMSVEGVIARPLFDERKIGWVVVVLTQLVENTPALGASRRDKRPSGLTSLFDLVLSGFQMRHDADRFFAHFR